MTDYRQETQDIIKNLKISKEEFCAIMRISDSTFRNWRDGKKPPTRQNFEALKEFADGQLPNNRGTNDLISKINSLIDGVETIKAKCDILNAKIDLIELRETQKKRVG